MAVGDEEFEVEKIISCRATTNGRISYLVRWKGYDANDDSWEPEENLKGCKDLVLKFFKERDVNPVKDDGYLILHLKKECPKPINLPKSSPGYSASDYSSNGSARRRNSRTKRQSSQKNRISDDEQETTSNSSTNSWDLRYSQKLRLTPERRNRVSDNFDDYGRGRSLFRSKDRPKSKRKPRTRSTSRTRNQGKPNPKSEKEKGFVEAKFNQVSNVKWTKQCQAIIFQVFLNVLFSLALTAALYVLLIYDLS